MSNYIGKISAIVTANTSDLSRKLGGARNELNAFGRSIQSSISSANRRASQSFNEIFTPLQRLQRALAAANRNPLDLRIDTTKVRELSDAANGLARPLAAAAKQFDKLGASVQQAFGPALSRAQGEVLDIQGFIEKFGRVSDETFVRVQRRVLDAATALGQLSQAQQRLNSLATGNELEFSDPRLAGNLAAAQRAGQNALSLSPGQIQADPQIEKLVRDIGELSQRAAAAAANVKNIRLSGGDTRAAQAQYDDINDELGLLISRLNKKYTLILDTEEAKKDAKEIREALAFSITGRARNFDQLKSQLAAARGEVEKFDDVQRRAFARDFGRLAAIIETNDVAKLQEASVILGRINGLIGARKQYDIDTAESGAALQRLQERLGSIAESLRRTPSDEFDRLEKSANEARAAIDKVADARARASLNRRAALIEGGIRADAANPTLTDADRRRRAGLDAAALGAIGRDAAESDRRAREGSLTRNAGASTRLIDRVGPSVTALRGQLNGLAEPLRASVGPEVDRLQNKFRLLARAGIAQSAEEVQRLKGEIAGLNAALSSRQGIGRDFLKSFGGEGAAGLSLGVDERSLRTIGGQIEFVQNRLSLLASEARGPVIQALEALRSRAGALFQGGALDTTEARSELERLRQELIRTLAAAEGGGTGGIEAGLRRAGDVGRLGVDKLQLGLQQAAFAVDDFFSVTGDFQQRLRAVSNNITQLGFVIGGTEGLFLGLAAVVGAQAFIQLEKFANANLDAADRIKSLNDALTRQKSIVESLAEAYRSVADAIAGAGLSGETRDLRERNKLIDDLRKKQNEQQRERVAGLNRDVQRERGIQTARQRELEATADPGERVRLEREIRQSRERERLATDAAVSRPGATAAQAVEAVADARFRAEAAAIEARARQAAGASGPGGQGQAAAEFQRQRELAAAEARRADFVAAGVGRVQGAGDARAQTAEANRIIDEAQQEIANSITTGFVGFFDGANQERRAQLARLEEERAQLEKDIFRAATNEVAIEATKTAIAASAEIGAALQLLTDALGSPAASAIGRQLEAITGSILAAERRIEAAQKTGDVAAAEAARAQVEAANAQKDALISAANSVVAFAGTLDRISTQLANTVAQEARSAADQARRDANAAQAQVDRGGGGIASLGDSAFADRQRQRAEESARRAEDRAAEVDRENARVRDAFDRDARRGGIGAETQRLIEERDAIDAVLRGDIAASDQQRQEASRRRSEIDRQLDRQFEDSPAGREARDRADEADRQRAADAQAADDIRRGRELSRSQAEQAGRQLAADLRALEAFRNERIAAGDPQPAIQQEFATDRQRIIEESFRSTAPAIFALADSVANAVLQGPSRAALQASDVSTVEGASELNRLLRGDDAGRDQNLVELQKQSQSLDELVRIAREGGAGIAN